MVVGRQLLPALAVLTVGDERDVPTALSEQLAGSAHHRSDPAANERRDLAGHQGDAPRLAHRAACSIARQ